MGFWGFVLFLLRPFFFLLCPKCLMHYRIWAHVGTFGCRLKGQWGRGGEAFREGREGRVRVRDSHSPGVQESQEGLWGQGDLEVPAFR